MIEKIKNLCVKNHKISNMFIKFYKNKEVSFDEIYISYKFIVNNKKKLTNSGINFLQIKNFYFLKSLLVNFGCTFSIVTEKSSLISKLDLYNVEYEEHLGQIQINANTYDIIKKFGADEWCITTSKKMYDQYNKNKETFLIFIFNKDESIKDLIGVTSTFKDKSSDFCLYNNVNKTTLTENIFIKERSFTITTEFLSIKDAFLRVEVFMFICYGISSIISIISLLKFKSHLLPIQEITDVTFILFYLVNTIITIPVVIIIHAIPLTISLELMNRKIDYFNLFTSSFLYIFMTICYFYVFFFHL